MFIMISVTSIWTKKDNIVRIVEVLFPCLMFILLFHNMYITLEVHKGFLWCIELPTPKKNKKLK
jgi:peptidoglycan biosynthesis protein MviN/MurJ (putative lipid II flippase)